MPAKYQASALCAAWRMSSSFKRSVFIFSASFALQNVQAPYALLGALAGRSFLGFGLGYAACNALAWRAGVMAVVSVSLISDISRNKRPVSSKAVALAWSVSWLLTVKCQCSSHHAKAVHRGMHLAL